MGKQTITWRNSILFRFSRLSRPKHCFICAPKHNPTTPMAHQHDLCRRRASADIGLHYVSLEVKQQKHSFEVKQQQQQINSSSPPVWDCGSSLYDSFELFTFTQHLNRAIAAQRPSPSSLSSASIMKDGRARSVSMPHFAFTPTSHLYNPLVKEDNEPMADVDLSHHSKLEPLHSKTRSRLGVPKLIQRLLTRLASNSKSTTGEKQHDLHCKASRTPFERMLYTAAHYC